MRASKECTSAPGRVMPTSIDLGYGGVVCRKLRKIGGDWEVSCGSIVDYSENDYTMRTSRTRWVIVFRLRNVGAASATPERSFT